MPGKPFYECVFPISHLNLPWHNLSPFTLVLLPGKTGYNTNYRIMLPSLLLCLLLLVTPQIRGERQFEAHWNTFAHLFLNLLTDWHNSLWFLARCLSPGEVGEYDCTNVLASLKIQQKDLLFIQLYFALLFLWFHSSVSSIHGCSLN